jgi:hypothetical protein
MPEVERELIAHPHKSSRRRRRITSVQKYDKLTWYSLVVVGVIFTIALNQYLADVQATLGIHILAISVPAILLSLLVILVRGKHNGAKYKGDHRILVRNAVD